ncbi:hypothetical protein [Allorhodopirellula solitaria]|uniref:hypothetical protein n=1 Tax=Allorhodopirellula solitaria TaxID=2527987 RepID=UPI0011B7A057|nr:hypothetical protein [Allorhodopirellula solitaria]
MDVVEKSTSQPHCVTDGDTEAIPRRIREISITCDALSQTAAIDRQASSAVVLRLSFSRNGYCWHSRL